MYDPLKDKPCANNKKIAVIDFDTPLVRASLAVQENYIVVTHKTTGWTKEFKNKTTFYGRVKARNAGWIGTQNKKREGTDKPLVVAEDFEIEELVRLTGEDFVAFGRVNKMLDMIINLPWVDGFKILVGGKGNFRDSVGEITEYKGDRPEKPLRFQAVKDYVLNKYRNYIVQEDGIEADDVIGWYSALGVKQAKETAINPYVLCFVDKDLMQCEGHILNYGKEELETFYNNQFDSAHHFFCQMLAGDTTDCIVGLPNFTDEIRTQYELRKSRGIGMATAEKYLEGCDTIKAMAKRTTEAYKSYYGEEMKDFTSWRGKSSKRNYLDFMKENGILLRMQSFKGHNYDIVEMLKKLGVVDE